MKNASRISARRVLQGGVAFAALGALTLGAASPAHADTYGWGYASALGASSPTQTYITKDQTVSDTFSGAIGDWLTVEGTTTATVNSSGATGTAVVDTARIVITEADLPGILDPEEDEDEDEETPDDEDDEDGEDGEDEGDDDASEGEESPEDGDGEGDTDVPDDGDTDQPTDQPSEQPTEEPAPQPTEEPSAPAEDGDDEAESTTASADVIELDEENSELVDGGSDVLLEATINGASVSTSQGWDGAVNHGFDAGVLGASTLQADVEGETVELSVSLEPVSAVHETEDAGFVWNDAITDMYITFSVGDEIVSGFLIAESAAGITTGTVDGGGDNGGGDNGGGDDAKNPPVKERDADTVPKTEAKDAQPLAQTGSPLAGLVAAGAAIAAGGGAAAYLARRKKKNGEEAPETNEG